MPRTAGRALLVMTLGALANSCGNGDGPTGPVPVGSVDVTPDPVSLAVGETVQLSAVVQDAAGEPLTGRNITWTSANSTIASVTGGQVRGVSEGTTDVSAVADGVAGTVAVTVAPARVASVDVRPSEGEVLLGETLQLTATPLGLGGIPLTGRAVTWSSSDEAVATVDPDGLVSGLTGGLVTISATVDQESGDALVEVVDPTAPRIAVITPFPMVEGASATLNGVNFGATAGDNAVTVDGVPAVVTDADGATVTFTVPATGCRPHRDVQVQATAGGKSGFATHPLRPTLTQVGVGEQVLLSGPGAPCLQFDASQTFESYLVGVQSTSDTESNLADFELAAETGVSAGGAAASPFTAFLARRPAAEPQRSPEALRSPSPLGVGTAGHTAARVAETELLKTSTFDFGSAASGALQSVIPPDATVGDQFTVRVPGHFPGGCSEFNTITARIELITDRGFWLADLANPLPGFSVADLQQLAAEFEDNVAPTLESTFGPIPDTDGNPRIAFVVTTEVNTVGWLSYASLFDYLPVAECPASNEGDWMYIATPTGTGNFSPQSLLDILGFSFAHDFTHVIQNRAVLDGGSRAETWIEEGQAELGSEIYTHAVTGREPRQNYSSGPVFSETGYNTVGGLVFYYGFLGPDEPKAVGAPQECSWVNPVPGGNPLGPCDPPAGSSAAWAFLRWATDHYAASIGGDEAFHQALIDETGAGFDRMATLTGVPIETLLARFGASLYVDDRITITEPTLDFPSWDLFDLDQNVFEAARLEPRAVGFANLSESGSVRAASTAYFTFSGPGRSATAIEVTGPGGGSLSPDLQVWAVRLQ